MRYCKVNAVSVNKSTETKPKFTTAKTTEKVEKVEKKPRTKETNTTK